ncbi:MAG: type IX secretion system membrane protein PorP/SprF [Gammaproteobacteria bacterium]|nr:type IX secretion system membrane protein PorP/SprF [Gammaproteobacteria bacterium]
MFSQEFELQNFYTQEPYLINPAYSGSDDQLQLFMAARAQWIGIDNSPVSKYAGAHMALYDHVGVGAYVIMNTEGLIKKNMVKLSYAYHMFFSGYRRFSFGLSGGVLQKEIDTRMIVGDSEYDAVLGYYGRNRYRFYTDLGFIYTERNFTMSLSFPELFISKDLHRDEITDQKWISSKINLYTAYLYKVNDYFKIKPSLLFRHLDNFIFRNKVDMEFIYKDLMNVNLIYTIGQGLFTSVGLRVLPNLDLYYGYGSSYFHSGKISTGTHEAMIKYRIGNSSIKNTTMPYYFISDRDIQRLPKKRKYKR